MFCLHYNRLVDTSVVGRGMLCVSPVASLLVDPALPVHTSGFRPRGSPRHRRVRPRHWRRSEGPASTRAETTDCGRGVLRPAKPLFSECPRIALRVRLSRSTGRWGDSRPLVQCPSRSCGWRAGLGTHNPSTVNVRSSSIERVQPVTLRYHSLDGLFMRVEREPIVCERSRRQ